MVAFYQGKIFKCLKEKGKFQQMLGKSMILKSKIIFKINIFKLIEKYPKLMRSSVTLTFLKNYLKDIKKVCEENLSDFKWVKVICLRKLLKLSLQKCLDKLFCKCCKIFKAYVTSRRVNFVLTYFSSLTAKLILLIFLNVLIISFWCRTLSHKLSIDLQKKSMRLGCMW